MRFSLHLSMIRRRRIIHIIQGVVVGLLFGLFVIRVRSPESGVNQLKCARETSSSVSLLTISKEPLRLIQLSPNENRHNSNRTLLFVGVMTAQKYLNTRAVAVYDTWGKELPGRIAFFSSEDSTPPRPDFPLISLKGVDDSYPPQKKSFMMLRYMWKHFGDRFEWFMRADDDVYVRPEKLEAFLKSVDSNKAHFIGQAGRGNQAEFGLLNLNYDENFCMGGPGVFLSRETLARIAPNIKDCLGNMYTTHEDVELGRCVRRFAGISCTWSYEVQNVADTDINVTNTDFIVTIDEKKNLQLNLGQYIDEEKNMKHCLVFKTCVKNMVFKSEDSKILLQNMYRILKYVKCKLFFIFPLNKNGLYVKTVRLYGRKEWSIILCDRGNVIDMTLEGLEIILKHVSDLLKFFV